MRVLKNKCLKLQQSPNHQITGCQWVEGWPLPHRPVAIKVGSSGYPAGQQGSYTVLVHQPAEHVPNASTRWKAHIMDRRHNWFLNVTGFKRNW